MNNEPEPGPFFWLASVAAVVAGWIAANYALKPLLVFLQWWNN